MTIYKNDPNYEISFMLKKHTLFNRWECQNQEGQQKHKITFFRISYKFNL